MHESLIKALRFCASGEKVPRLCTEACPLYCAKGNASSGVQMGWLASQADMLAEDWKIVE